MPIDSKKESNTRNIGKTAVVVEKQRLGFRLMEVVLGPVWV